MKLKNIFVAALAAVAALFTGCQSMEEELNHLDGITLGSTYITIAKGQTSASTTMTIEKEWTSSAPDWVKLDPAYGPAGNYTLNFIAQADTLSEGEVRIYMNGKYQRIVVIRDGDKAKKAGVIFEEPFVGHGQGDFEIKNVVGNPWSYDAKYGMKATAYINNANTDAESYLISPEIDLTEETVAMLTFENAVNYMNGNAVTDYLSVEVTTDNGAKWEKVEVPTWPAGSGWDFVRSGDVDLSAYLGKKIKFAFHYISNTAASPTWEVKNVKVSNVAGAVPPVVEVSPVSVTLEAAEGSSAVVTATADGGTLEVSGPFSDENCTVEDSPAWLTVSLAGTECTLTAAENPGDARVCYVKLFATNDNGTTAVVVTVTQAANPGAKGAAITNPYTVAEALEICKNKTYTDADVYVKGIINTIDNISLDYGNAQFWISDDGATADLEAYRNFWFDGAKYTSEDQLKVGDEVIICGKLTLYEKDGQDPICEFAKNNQIVSLNGGVRYYTVAQAIEALKDGSAPTDDKVFVSGIINTIDNISLDYGNAQYWISDDGTTADFEIYRGFYLGGEKFTSEDQIAVGDAVTVLGNIKIYKKDGNPDVYEFDKNNYIYFLTHTDAPVTQGITVDGNPADWEGVEGVANAECPADAELTGIKSARAYYGDKLYILAEFSDAALAQGVTDGKLRFHVFFSGAQGLLKRFWKDENIQYMMEGKATSGGSYTNFSSPLYQFTGATSDAWSWSDSGVTPAVTSAGNGNFYEVAIDYSNYPGGFPEQIEVGIDCANGDYEALGFAPQTSHKFALKKGEVVELPDNPEEFNGPTTIAEVIAAIPATATGNSTAAEFEVRLAAPAVVSYVNGNNAYIQDETGAILVYLNGHGLEAGDTVTGKLAAKGYWYNGIPELVALGDAFEKGHGAVPAPKEITIADLIANYDANLLRLVKLTGVTVTGGIADGDRNGEVAQGEDKIAVYAQLNNKGLVLEEGKTGDLVTIPGKYKEAKQVYLWDNAWFTEGSAPEPVSITIDGDMSDWAGVADGLSSEEGPYLAFKAANDDDNIYLYSKRTWHDGLWKASSGGYYYYEFDTDNNPETGTNSVNGNTGYGVEAWMYLYLFTGSADAPTFASTPDGSGYPSGDVLENVAAAGVTDKSVIETEVKIPLANIGVSKGQTIRIYTWGNKSAGNLKSADSYLLYTVK